MAVEGADQRALPALGAQVGVDLEERLGGDAHHRRGEPGGDVRLALAHEDHVDVADVVQLAAAALAHPDDPEPARQRIPGLPVVLGAQGVGDRGVGDGQRGAQARGGEVGELGGDDLDRHDRQLGLAHRLQVGGGEGEHLVAVGQAQHPDPGGLEHRGAGHGGPLLGAHRGQQRAGALREVGQHRGVVGAPGRALALQAAPALGVGDEMVAERRRATEHAEQAAAQALVAAQRLRERRPLRLVERLAQTLERQQREVRVGAAGERARRAPCRSAGRTGSARTARCAGRRRRAWRPRRRRPRTRPRRRWPGAAAPTPCRRRSCARRARGWRRAPPRWRAGRPGW